MNEPAEPEWSVSIDGQLVRELEIDFMMGAIEANGGRLLLDHQVARVDGMKIEVFSNEHPPPHFRVKHGGETNCYDICTGEPLYQGLDNYRRNIKKWHSKHRDALIEAWNKNRPTSCPVGPVDCADA